MTKSLHPVLSRFKNMRVVFHGKFQPSERECLSQMTQAHGGTVASDLDAKVTHLVLPVMASGAAMRKKAASLRNKGTAIEVMDAAAFRELVNPTQDELMALLKDGRRGAKALAAVAPRMAGNHGVAPGSPALQEPDWMDRPSQFDFSGLAFEDCRFIGDFGPNRYR